MKKQWLYWLVIVQAIVCLSGCIRDNSHSASALIRTANNWKVGDNIPERLLKYEEQTTSLLLPFDSLALYYDISNYGLLFEVVCHPNAEIEVFHLAVEKCLRIAGPKRFFLDLSARYSAQATVVDMQRHKVLRERMKDRHIHIESLSIGYEDMREREAREVFHNINKDLDNGMSWNDMYKIYSEKYRRTDVGDLWRTKIGRFGNYVISRTKSDALPLRNISVPSAHVRTILQASIGDMLILKDDSGKEYMFYKILKVHEGQENNF